VCHTIHSEDGVALVMAMMTLLLMTGLGAALVLTTASETAIAGNFRGSAEALYAADAAIECMIGDLRTASDWNLALSGASRSAFIDGAPDGLRTLIDGSALDLTRMVNMANCDQPSACSDSDMDQVRAYRPWGPNNPRWQLYVYGPLSQMVPTGTINSPFYVIGMVADDPSENDANPLLDGIDTTNPGAGVLALRAEAFGPRGAHRVIEATVARQPDMRLLSWREVR
jgi:hypothetical protein